MRSYIDESSGKLSKCWDCTYVNNQIISDMNDLIDGCGQIIGVELHSSFVSQSVEYVLVLFIVVQQFLRVIHAQHFRVVAGTVFFEEQHLHQMQSVECSKLACHRTRVRNLSWMHSLCPCVSG